jgi:FAD/FMN-containing dehydrogenase
MILANGEITTVSRDMHADLYHATAGSSGTFGVLTAATIQLIPAKRYVHLTYTPVHSFEQARRTIAHTTKEPVDFVDGIMFSDTSGVVVSGVLSNQKLGKTKRFKRAQDQWYYLHVQDTLNAHPDQGWVETVPIVDYLFRYDRGAFWVGKYAFETFGVPFTRVMRFVLNPLLHTRKLYQALQESGASQRHVVQDLILPADTVTDFMQSLHAELGIYPLWLCPLKRDSDALFQLNHLETDAIINIGVWGPELSSHADFMAANRFIEKLVLEAKGRKWSYGHSYYSLEEFWQIYDKTAYDELRQKYRAETLPSMYEKLTVTNQYPIDRKKGLLKTIVGTAKLHIQR